MTEIMWQASQERAAQANITKFIHFVNETYHLTINNYADLYDWSTEQPEKFWQSVWQFGDVHCSVPAKHILENANKMPGAQWFTEAKLNFAENLLSRNDEKTAIIFRGENGARRELSYQQLHQKVARLSNALRAHGLTAGDRIAGYMPNIPETIIAMLATASIGAIWSSCSPDFGSHAIIDRFGQIKPKILFCSDGQFYNGKQHSTLDKVEQLVEQIPSIEKIVVVPFISEQPKIDSLKNAVLFNDFLSDNLTLKFEQLLFDHPLYILYSSGTTGAPKCIVHGAGGTLLQHLKELMLHTDLQTDDVLFYFTTCGWMMWNWMVSGLAVGATLVLFDGAPTYPKADTLIDLIDEEHISIFGTSAKFISALEKAHVNPAKTHHLSSLKTILSTGSPLLPANFDYVYKQIKADLCLSSISGGTDIVSCFALGCPTLPVYRGELQCRGLGMTVNVYNEQGQAVQSEKGELVCETPFPCMPIYFWNDENGERYHNAYFSQFDNIWAHGDYAEITDHGGVIIHGRSDAVLNPGGVRIGTAEIYRQVEKFDDIIDALVIGQDWRDDVRVVLFVKLRDGLELNEVLQKQIKTAIRQAASPRHVPSKIIQINDIPKTISGKIVELAVREIVHGRPVKNKDALANPEALEQYAGIDELQRD